MLDQPAEMRVAGGQFGEGVADADDRPTVEIVFGYALVLHPAAMKKGVLIRAAEPMLRAQILFVSSGHCVSHLSIYSRPTPVWLRRGASR